MAKAKTTWRKRLDALRKRMGLDQADFAERLGVGLGTLRAWLYKGLTPGGSAARLIELLEDLHRKSQK